jgi:predicted alpha/beta superfamily hydrolase
MVLRQLFRDPGAFQIYIAASPAIRHSSYAVLMDEAAFSERVREGKVDARVLITSAELEQYRGNDPKKLEQDKGNHFIDDAEQLAARLKSLNPKRLPVDYVIFPGEKHFTVSLAELGRGMCFAFDKPPSATKR